MSKYINTEQIEQYLHREEHGTPDERWRPESEFARIIECIPSADVVEVVRCKDCKNSVCVGECYFCLKQYNKRGQPNVVKTDGFCDAGERKETE